ncbi:MAG TPA: NAD(P)/FAD-dependent oxidoreductase, partial [Acidimicrobiales bacterium]|nr:NAD(P)/FAD-dependent oxidoreductase [Acidimicrobiales bacterium]
GIDYLVVEKNQGVGGTWYENTYPGARVDVASRSYSYSFEPSYPWEHHYALQPEITGYFDYVADKYGLAEHIRFETEVESARWLEADGLWEVRLRSTATGDVDTVVVNAIVSAVGLFNRPKEPDLEGLEDFAGHLVHTSKWDHDYDLAGKRVALIGTGASGTQLVAGIAPLVSSLSIFQRAGTWVSNLPNYTDQIHATERWLIQHFPYYVNWVRILTTYSLSDKRLPIYDVDEDWDDLDSVSEINHKMRTSLVDYMMGQIGDRPDLVAKCVPTYPVMAKRLPKDNGWFQALKRDNVDLVVEAIDRITETGVRTVDGVDHDVDLLVLATGFRVNDFLWPMRIEGTDGVTLEEAWQKDGARAYLGITIPGFPNLFCMYGPNSNSKSGGICMWGEFQARYLTLCMKYLIEHDRRSLSVRPEVFDEFNRTLDDRLRNAVWLDPRQVSYYRNAFNRVATNAPWATLEYWQMTREPALEDFVVT